MNHKILLFACALLLPAAARAQYRYAYPEDMEPAEAVVEKPHVPRLFRYYYAAGRGSSSPTGGGWAGKTGFKSSPSLVVAVGKKVDAVLSYGLETSYDSGHKSRALSGMSVRVFSFAPFLRAASVRGGSAYYAIAGAGVYHWSQSAFGAAGARRASDSGSSLGLSLGGGAIYPFGGALKFGLDLRWRHVFSVSGVNFDADLINNITPSIMLYYGFLDIP